MIVFPEIMIPEIKIQVVIAIYVSGSFKNRNCFVMHGQHQKIVPADFPESNVC